jgi:hypothetical protein
MLFTAEDREAEEKKRVEQEEGERLKYREERMFMKIRRLEQEKKRLEEEKNKLLLEKSKREQEAREKEGGAAHSSICHHFSSQCEKLNEILLSAHPRII